MLITNYEDGNNNVNKYSSKVLLQMTSYMSSRKFHQDSGIKINTKVDTYKRPVAVYLVRLETSWERARHEVLGTTGSAYVRAEI
jgi:hypothetical protein